MTNNVESLPIFVEDFKGNEHILYLKIDLPGLIDENFYKLAYDSEQYRNSVKSFYASSQNWDSVKDSEFGSLIRNDVILDVIEKNRNMILEVCANYLIRHILSRRIANDKSFTRIYDNQNQFRSIFLLAAEEVGQWLGVGSLENEQSILNDVGELMCLYLFNDIYSYWIDTTIAELGDAMGPETAISIFSEQSFLDNEFTDRILIAVNNYANIILRDNSAIEEQIIDLFRNSKLSPLKSYRTAKTSSDVFTQNGVIRLATSRLLGLALDAQTHRPDWQSHPDVPLGYETGDTKGRFSVVFYLGNEVVGKNGGPIAHERPVAMDILKRWGIYHARLYLAIGAMLTRSKGNMAELNEADLMCAIGVQNTVANGKMTRSKAREIILNALNDLKQLSLHLISSDEDIISGKFPVYQIEPLPLYKRREEERQIQNIRARISPGLWARDFFTFEGGPSFSFNSAILNISPSYYPLAALFSIWFSYNQYRFDSGRSITIRNLLKEILPNRDNNEIQDIGASWELLEPSGETCLSTETKNARGRIRKQVYELKEVLEDKGISVDFSKLSRSSGSNWNDFLSAEITASVKNNKIIEGKDKKTRGKGATSESSIDQIKSTLLERKISQKKIAEIVGVSQGTISNWLSGKTPIPKKALKQIVKFIDV